MGRFRYWLLSDFIQMDEATIRSHWIIASQFLCARGNPERLRGGGGNRNVYDLYVPPYIVLLVLR